jgi:hypothetical protein
VLGYTLANGSRVSRVFFIVADEHDGLVMTPAADKHGGVPVVPRTVACGTVPMLYETELENERLARAEHVRYWRELDTPAAVRVVVLPPEYKPRPTLLSRLLGR